jgi:polyhydroxybutyrate depolymerase
MRKKIIGILVMTLLITTCVLPVIGEIITLKNENRCLQKSNDDINSFISGTTSLEFMIAGKALRVLRSYWLHVPLTYDESKALPLVIVLHGSTGFNLRYPFSFFRSSWMEDYTEFSMKADEEEFIVVYPNAKFDFYTSGFDYNYGYVLGGVPKFVDDVGFLRDLINKMKQDYKINLSRIYVTGISDGAAMSYSIGSYLSDEIAAIAPVAGMIGGCLSLENDDFYQIPTPPNPVSVIVFHGTNDSLLPYEGGGEYNLSSVNESISFWVEHNGCNLIPEINISASGKIVRRTYTDGENGTEVILYTTVGGDHWWPGNPWISRPGSPWLVDAIQEISATDLIWEFFEQHPKQ